MFSMSQKYINLTIIHLSVSEYGSLHPFFEASAIYMYSPTLRWIIVLVHVYAKPVNFFSGQNSAGKVIPHVHLYMYVSVVLAHQLVLSGYHRIPQGLVANQTTQKWIFTGLVHTKYKCTCTQCTEPYMYTDMYQGLKIFANSCIYIYSYIYVYCIIYNVHVYSLLHW